MSQDSVTSVYSEIPVQKSVQYSQLLGGVLVLVFFSLRSAKFIPLDSETCSIRSAVC